LQGGIQIELYTLEMMVQVLLEDCTGHGTNATTERALGALTSGSSCDVVNIGGRYVNNTGSTVSSFDIPVIEREQWRQTANLQTLVFEYQVGATALTTGTWTAVTGLNFTAPVGGTAGAIDGNAVANYRVKTATITVTVTNGQEIWFRWTETGTTSPGLAIDDVSVTANAACSPPYQTLWDNFRNITCVWFDDVDLYRS